MAQHSDLIAQRMIGYERQLRNLGALTVGAFLSVGLSTRWGLYVPLIFTTWISIVIMALVIAWRTVRFTERVLSGKQFDQMGLNFLSATERTSALMRVVLHRWRWWLLLLMGMLPGLIIGSVHTQADVAKLFASLVGCDSYGRSLDRESPSVTTQCNEITFDSELIYLKQAGAFGLGLFGVMLLAMVLGVRFEWARLIAVGGTLLAVLAVWTCANSRESFNNLIGAIFPYALCFVFLRPPRRKTKSLLAE